MKNLAPEWQQHLSLNVTQVCKCLKIYNDVEMILVTDHDRILEFNGHQYLPDDRLEIEPAKSTLNLSLDAFILSTCMNENMLSQSLVQSGFLNNAKFELYHVNWHNLSEFTLIKKGFVGGVTFLGGEIKLEMRGLTAPLNNKYGRLLQERCDAKFADDRCKINAELAVYNAAGHVSELASTHTFGVALPANIINGYFEHGYLEWQTGDNASISEVRYKIERQYKKSNGRHLIELQQNMKFEIKLNDQMKLKMGCAKSFDTCANKFSNGTQFRGFSHMPGKNFRFAYPQHTLLEE